MMKNFFLLSFLFLFGSFSAQEPPNIIKIRKQQLLKKAQYDETDYKVIAVDRYGNPKTESVVGFELHFKEKGKERSFISSSNLLTPEMIAKLKELKKATQVWFTKIKGDEGEGHLVDLPNFDYMIFPKCINCPGPKKKS